MSETVAVFRTACSTDSPTLLSVKALGRVRGVAAVTPSVATRELRVRFDRSVVSIGDLVQMLESHGIRIGSVSQSHSTAAVRSASA